MESCGQGRCQGEGGWSWDDSRGPHYFGAHRDTIRDPKPPRQHSLPLIPRHPTTIVRNNRPQITPQPPVFFVHDNTTSLTPHPQLFTFLYDNPPPPCSSLFPVTTSPPTLVCNNIPPLPHALQFRLRQPPLLCSLLSATRPPPSFIFDNIHPSPFYSILSAATSSCAAYFHPRQQSPSLHFYTTQHSPSPCALQFCLQQPLPLPPLFNVFCSNIPLSLLSSTTTSQRGLVHETHKMFS